MDMAKVEALLGQPAHADPATPRSPASRVRSVAPCSTEVLQCRLRMNQSRNSSPSRAERCAVQVALSEGGSPDDAGGLLIPEALLRSCSSNMDEPAAPLGPPLLEAAAVGEPNCHGDANVLNNVVRALISHIAVVHAAHCCWLITRMFADGFDWQCSLPRMHGHVSFASRRHGGLCRTWTR